MQPTRHRLRRAVTALLTLFTALTLVAQQLGQDEVVAARARGLHARAIVVDTHDDTTQRMVSEPSFDIGARGSTGSIDIPRMREGGLDALFFAIYMPGSVTGPQAVKRALQQIDMVREAIRARPRELVLATYDWESLAKKLENVWERLYAARRTDCQTVPQDFARISAAE